MRILANDGISKAGINKLKSAGYIVDIEKVDQDNLIEEINKKGVQIVLVRSATTVRKEVIDNCPNLKLIGRGGVGMDNIDVNYAREKGLTVINTPAASSQSVAELVLGQLLSISRFFHESYKNIDHDDFSVLKKNYGNGVELRGKTLGIIGFGRIGQSLASYALGCGMKVIAISKEESNITINLPEIQGIGKLSTEINVHTNLHEYLPQLDFISVHVPKQPDGSAVFNKKEFDLMKNGVRIVNAARGGVVNEEALLEAINSGKVAAAGLDVYENEPNPRKEILEHTKIACTPHIGAATIEAQDRIGEELADLIIAEFGKF